MTLTHQEKMAKVKKVMDKRIARADEERGVLILITGNGKGKSSSAFGTMARTVGHGQKAAVVQFSKGRLEVGEYKLFAGHELIDWYVMGHGFTWETQNKEQDIASAQEAWQQALALLQNEDYQILVFDEMSYMFKYGYLSLEPVIEALEARPKHQNVIITGRGMPEELIEVADTVSDIRDRAHAFRKGVKAQAGIEY